MVNVITHYSTISYIESIYDFFSKKLVRVPQLEIRYLTIIFQESLKEIRESLGEYDDYFGFTPEFGTAEPETMEKMLDFIQEK